MFDSETSDEGGRIISTNFSMNLSVSCCEKDDLAGVVGAVVVVVVVSAAEEEELAALPGAVAAFTAMASLPAELAVGAWPSVALAAEVAAEVATEW